MTKFTQIKTLRLYLFDYHSDTNKKNIFFIIIYPFNTIRFVIFDMINSYEEIKKQKEVVFLPTIKNKKMSL